MQVHLVHLTSIKIDKSCTQMILCNFSTTHMARSGWMTTYRRQHQPKKANSVSLFLQIWQLRMPTLNQRLRSFPTESRVAIFLQCRQDSPLPPPINRSEFHSLREKKIRSKVCHLLSVFLSLTLHRPNSKPRPPPISPASFPPQATARPPYVKSVTTVAAASTMWAAAPLAAKLSINAATSLTLSSTLARHHRHAWWYHYKI